MGGGAGPPTALIDLGPTCIGPGPVVYSRIQPWLLLKTQARRLLQPQPALSSAQPSRCPECKSDRCAGPVRLSPRPQAMSPTSPGRPHGSRQRPLGLLGPVPRGSPGLCPGEASPPGFLAQPAPRLRLATCRTLCLTSASAHTPRQAAHCPVFSQDPSLLCSPRGLPTPHQLTPLWGLAQPSQSRSGDPSGYGEGNRSPGSLT